MQSTAIIANNTFGPITSVIQENVVAADPTVTLISSTSSNMTISNNIIDTFRM